jgi:homoserine dehydrogenase
MSSDSIVVLKFGSSVLAEAADIPVAVHEIYRYLRQGKRVVAVVSAMGPTTDRLLSLAHSLSGSPEPAGLAALLATGEATTAALLAMALDRAGIPATLLDPGRVGLRTEGPVLDAKPREINRRELFRVLEHRPVVVLSGFVGQDAEGRTTLLGRGGSDFSALFIAHQLGAECCRLIKDVDGLYESDPASHLAPRRFLSVSWEDARLLGGGVVQDKALHYAERFRLSIEITAPCVAEHTVVGPGPSRLAERAAGRPPLRVTLLGLGTVGLGVYRYLTARPGRFTVAGIAVRDPRKHRGEGVPPELLSSDPWAVLALPSDVVVEAIGGEHPASDLVAAALTAGRDVVTANKAVMATNGRHLADLAAAHAAHLAYSATVGGGVPVVETVERVAKSGTLRSVEGVLNATTNFVLDQIVAGCDLAGAVKSAQDNGFAEADPTFDLDGTDAAHKLVIVARAAFGADLKLADVDRHGIDHLDPEEVRAAHAEGAVVRLVASCRQDGDGIAARVCPVRLPPDHPLAQTRNEENRVLIQPQSGPAVVVDGKGAGRWPTAEAVLADILDIYRLRRSQPEDSASLTAVEQVWESGIPLGLVQ